LPAILYHLQRVAESYVLIAANSFLCFYLYYFSLWPLSQVARQAGYARHAPLVNWLDISFNDVF
jgi:hypothetical protein